MRRTLVIFVKAPRLGAVKRRLARGIGYLAATAFYRATLARMVATLGGDRRWTTRLCVTPDLTAGDGGLWPPGAPARDGQGAGDLGRRMARALTRAARGGGSAVLIGGDIPAITPAHIERAFRALSSHDAVFGPAADGGYWLVGFRKPPGVAHPFRGVRWSGPHALADTLKNLAGRKVARIDVLEDIDEAAAWRRWRD